MLLVQTTDGKCYMAYRITSFPMTLSDFQGHAPIAGVLIAIICTTVQQF